MSKRADLAFIIPTWNNLATLQFCLESVRKNCTRAPEVVLHINDGSDGTLEWARREGILHTHSAANIGICQAVNQARALTTARHLVYLNDDMFVCPGLDEKLLARAAALRAQGCDLFMLSGTMIEARESGNACVVVRDYGKSPQTFAAERLLADLATLKRPDWNGSAWPPVLLPAEAWDKVGGFSVEFSPGMYSDPDLAMKLWFIGCREFIGLGDAFVYHFPSQSTGRLRKPNDGRTRFLRKWGVASSTFTRFYLRRGSTYAGPLGEPDAVPGYRLAAVLDRIKRVLRS